MKCMVVSSDSKFSRVWKFTDDIHKYPLSIVVMLIALSPQSAMAFTANISGSPNPNTGDYTVSWSNPAHYTYKLQELVSGGGWIQITSTTGSSYPFTGKATNEYFYRLKWQKLVCTGYPEPECYLVIYYSETTSVTVQAPPPPGGEDPFPPPGPFTPPDDSDFPDATIINPSVPTGDIYGSSVGAVQGTGGVSGGQASYSIPIVVPPGRKGMQPSVSLNYSSSSGNGLVGVGWGLNAASAISRCSATPAQDGFTAAVQYDAGRDRLCLDGRRLMVEPGYSYGQSGAHYRTEIDSFAQVIQNGSLNGTTTSFTVKYKNGQTSNYGTDGNTRHTAGGKNETLSWAIKESQDPSGNTISYDYWNYGDGEWPIQAIHYTGFNGSSGDRHVRFEYETRPDADLRTSYLSGGKTRSTKRLWKIKTEYQAQLVREYTLTYGSASASTNRSLLRSIQECAYEGGTVQHCLPETQFTWQEQAPQYVTEPLEFDNNGTPLLPHENDRWLHDVIPHGDNNGDGVKDFSDWYVNAEGEVIGQNANPAANCFKLLNSWVMTCLDADFDADGRTDSFQRNETTDTLEIAYADAPTNWIDTGITWNYSSFSAIADKPLAFADFNGDGRADIAMKHRKAGASNSQLFVYFHTGNDAAPFQDIASANRRQLIHSYSAGGSSTTHQKSVEVYGDMDGNGTPDFVVSAFPTTTQVPGLPRPVEILLTESQPGGSITVTSRPITNLLEDVNTSAHFFHDLNGDGLQDFIAMGLSANHYLKYRLNDGTDFVGSWASLGFSIPTRTGTYQTPDGPEQYVYPIMSKILVMDYDGDGRQELLAAKNTVVASGCSLVVEISGSSWKCDDALYGEYQANEESNYESPINGAVKDNSIRQYQAYSFGENAAGAVTVGSFTSQIIASAAQTAVIDATGDGLPDVITVFGCRLPEPAGCLFNDQTSGEGGTVNSNYEQEGAWINRNRGTATGTERFEGYDLMSAVEDGLGNRHEWVYRPLSSDKYDRVDEYGTFVSDFYRTAHADLANDPDYFHFASSMYVVADHRASNGIGGLNSTKYRYRGAVYNNKGRGFQGFKSIIVEEDVYDAVHSLASTDKISRTDFHHLWPKTGIVEQACVWVALRTTSSMTIQIAPISFPRRARIPSMNSPLPGLSEHWVRRFSSAWSRRRTPYTT